MKAAPYHMTIVMMVALGTLLILVTTKKVSSEEEQEIDSDLLTRNIAKLQPNSQLQCNARRCQAKIRWKGLSRACKRNYCNGCAACSGGGGGSNGGSGSCTQQSACGSACTACQRCFLNARGDLNNIVGDIRNGQLSGASNCKDALDNAIRRSYSIRQCLGRYPTCSAYLACQDATYASVCPSWKQEQCSRAGCASLLQASRPSGAVNSSASQAVVNANVDIDSVTTARENIDASSIEASMLQQRAAAQIGQRDEHHFVRQKSSLERDLDAGLTYKCM